MRRRFRAGALALAVLSTGTLAEAAEYIPPWLMDIDYELMTQHYAGAQATGSNVPVTIVETRDPNTNGYYPDASQSMFAGKTLTARSGALGNSDHAKVVGGFFFGTPPGGSSWRSAAPGINNVDMFSYSSWEGVDFLKPATGGPKVSPNNSRVASFAYAGALDQNTITRMDWVVRRDDYVLIVGSQVVSGHGSGFNSISVAPTAGNTGVALDGTSAIGTGTPYAAGRFKPDITGPHGTTSDSTGAVAGVAALLISRGKADATLSNHSYIARPGYTVRSAETSEVVKAALMAGALRSTNGNQIAGNITNYRASESHQTANGLDKRCGAGLVNVYNSYRIIDAGEHDSIEAGDTSAIAKNGFDYSPSFGGAGGAAASATYTFVPTADGKFAATLAWNVDVVGIVGQSTTFDSTATLVNMDLKLLDLTTGQSAATSASTIDNTENLYVDLVAGHVYQMVVERGPGQAAFNWDYGLAWHSDVTFVPEPASAVLALLLGGLMSRPPR